MDSWSMTEPEDEYEKLVNGMNPPRVTVDNTSSRRATLVKVDSVNKQGSLLKVVQVLSDLNLVVRRAYITSDGEWFMDVFHVVDQNGNKIFNTDVIERIQQSLDSSTFKYRSLRRSVGVEASTNHTTIELIGTDRPGLLSEIFAVLADQQCNIVASEMWTHNLRMASIVLVTDVATGLPIYDTGRLEKIKQLLSYVLKGSTDISFDLTHVDRRLHQIMYANRDYDRGGAETGALRGHVQVTVENCNDRGYTIVNVRCNDRQKILLDTVCTLTDMQYVIFHATVIAEGPEAYLELYVRHIDGSPVSSDGERQRIVLCLEAAIRRRNPEGIRFELCCEDRVGLLAEVTRIFRENGLSVTQAEVTTRDSKALNTFYVVDASGDQVRTETIEVVRNTIGQTILLVKDDNTVESNNSSQARFSLGNLFRSRSEKFFYNLGLIRSS
ncbi:ACT domain-containing protein ACR4-like [Carex rostrata]